MKFLPLLALTIFASTFVHAEKCFYLAQVLTAETTLPSGKKAHRYYPDIPKGYTWTATIKTNKKTGKPMKNWCLVQIDAADHTELKKTLKYVCAKRELNKAPTKVRLAELKRIFKDQGQNEKKLDGKKTNRELVTEIGKTIEPSYVLTASDVNK